MSRQVVRVSDLKEGSSVYIDGIPGQEATLPTGTYHVRATHPPIESDIAPRTYVTPPSENNSAPPVYFDELSVDTSGNLNGVYVPSNVDKSKGYIS